MSTMATDEYASMLVSQDKRMTAQDRRKKRSKKKSKIKTNNGAPDTSIGQSTNKSMPSNGDITDDRFADLLLQNEDELLTFVAQVNDVYQDKLKKDAPFMTFMLCGMQSAGKSTIMERFLNSVLNIVQEGTGTRCPLDTTCIHDASCVEPSCDLSGEELPPGKSGKNLKPQQVFEYITEHNRKLGNEDRFSTKALHLVYRAHNVQNMRFVDTPGIISNKEIGNDNREAIKTILRNELHKPNTKLCILLEPKEYATNAIVDFCDETFGDRDAWIHNATFLMTKFDKQLEDSRTGSKANKFFKPYHDLGCFPHLVITPTLAKEDLKPEELFQARTELLNSADEVERKRFSAWCDLHDQFNKENAGDEPLRPETKTRIGFSSAKEVMREIMLRDTVKRLPEVLAELRSELSSLQKQQRVLEEKKKFSDPRELKSVVGNIAYEIERKLISYLDGDLESAIKYPELLQTLDDELEEEDTSDWTERELNHFTEAENNWRNKIASLEGEYPDSIQPDERFLGGKQLQRAIAFFGFVMIDSLPDPFQLRSIVSNATGFLGGGLQRENWERAMVQITTVTVRNVSHPGINFLIKHVGCVIRRLFLLALEAVKYGEELSATFKLIPSAVEKHLMKEFDDMLWSLMQEAARMTHLSLEPMYSTIAPDLPTFHPQRFGEDEDNKERYSKATDGTYQREKTKKEKQEATWIENTQKRISALLATSGDQAKLFLKQESASKAQTKNHFLPDERTAMITNEEKEKILRRSFEYIVALMEFILISLRFQLYHYLINGFKKELGRTFKNRLMNDADWDELIQPDESLAGRLSDVQTKINGVESSLREVERLQRKM